MEIGLHMENDDDSNEIKEEVHCDVTTPSEAFRALDMSLLWGLNIMSLMQFVSFKRRNGGRAAICIRKCSPRQISIPLYI